METETKDLKYFLEKYGIKLKKRLGQNFLVDKNIIQKEVALAQIKPDETLLEIGPGVGFLTRELLKYAKKVVAIEMDKNLAEILEKELPDKKLEVICADALQIDFPEFDKCVSNIPYEVSSKIILKLGKLRKPAVLIMQKEFAERLAAKPGEREYSKISVMSQYYFDSGILHIVSKKSFFPAPKVDSAIVRLTPKHADLKKSLGISDEEFFLKIIHALFQHKNMTVRNALIHSRNEFGFEKDTAKKIAENISLKDAKVRTLDLAMLAKVAKEIKKHEV
ncbi:putative ribosomal RNA small subunit methyltransferase A [uncultured archaeon]|nr:putative ribosomal RNA small subunit methyltransferase A [uncultured archaeon]